MGAVIQLRRPDQIYRDDATEVAQLSLQIQAIAESGGCDGAVIALTLGPDVVMTTIVGAVKRDKRTARRATTKLLEKLGWGH